MSANAFARKMAILFGEPKTEDPVGFLAEYANAFRDVPKALQERAADVLIRQRKFRSWPTVAECLDALAVARKQSRSAPIGLQPIDNFDQWWDDRVEAIMGAPSQAVLSAELAKIQPYADAGWIAESRMPEAMRLAGFRSRALRGEDGLTERSRQMAGDAE